MRHRLPVLLALALTMVAACSGGEPQAADSLVEIAGPESFLAFELRDDRERVLWRLVAARPAPLERLVYGEVPAGFRQEVPGDGAPPRPLEAGEPLTLVSLTPRREFFHQGFAEDGQRFAIDRWAMRLRQPPPAEPAAAEALDGPAADS